MSLVRACSSSRTSGSWRWVERDCPSTLHARRSETPKVSLMCWMHRRRRAGLRSFPQLPPLVSGCPGSVRPLPASAGCSRFPVASGAGPGQPGDHRTRPSSGRRSAPRRRCAGRLLQPYYPEDMTTSVSLSLLMISSAVCFLLAMSQPPGLSGILTLIPDRLSGVRSSTRHRQAEAQGRESSRPRSCGYLRIRTTDNCP